MTQRRPDRATATQSQLLRRSWDSLAAAGMRPRAENPSCATCSGVWCCRPLSSSVVLGVGAATRVDDRTSRRRPFRRRRDTQFGRREPL